ncbi:unnamed protein product, partial [Rangifer tarandus platyrhynchus]
LATEGSGLSVEPGPAPGKVLAVHSSQTGVAWHLQAVRCGQSLGPRLVPGAPEYEDARFRGAVSELRGQKRAVKSLCSPAGLPAVCRALLSLGLLRQPHCVCQGPPSSVPCSSRKTAAAGGSFGVLRPLRNGKNERRALPGARSQLWSRRCALRHCSVVLRAKWTKNGNPGEDVIPALNDLSFAVAPHTPPLPSREQSPPVKPAFTSQRIIPYQGSCHTLGTAKSGSLIVETHPLSAGVTGTSAFSAGHTPPAACAHAGRPHGPTAGGPVPSRPAPVSDPDFRTAPRPVWAADHAQAWAGASAPAHGRPFTPGPGGLRRSRRPAECQSRVCLPCLYAGSALLGGWGEPRRQCCGACSQPLGAARAGTTARCCCYSSCGPGPTAAALLFLFRETETKVRSGPVTATSAPFPFRCRRRRGCGCRRREAL